MKRTLLFLLCLAAGTAGATEPVPGQVVRLRGVLTDLTSGRSVNLAEATAGRKTLLFFWSTWCSSCAEKVPQMNALYRQFYGRDDLRFLSICGDNGTEDADLSDLTPERAARAYVIKSRIRYPALFDTPARRLTAGFFDQTFPTFFLLNGDGTVIASWNSAGGYEHFLAKTKAYFRLGPSTNAH